MRSRGLAEALSVAVAAAALTAVLTHPLVAQIDRIGRVNTNDGRWSLWVVSWVAHALTTDPRQLFHANIFHPHQNTLAYSEPNIVAGAVGAPVWYLSRNPYLTHNVVVVLGFILAAAGAYYLARYLTRDRGAAAVAGVMFAFCPFIFARTAHIQLLLTAGLPWCLLAMHRLVDAPGPRRAVIVGVAVWLQALACAYYGIFAGLMVALGAVVYGVTRRTWRQPAYWLRFALAGAVAIGLTIPFFLPYLDVQQELGFTRQLEESRAYSADLGAWFASSAWAHRWWLPRLGGFNEVLFPGILAMLLGTYGAWRALGRAPAANAPVRSTLARDSALFYVLVIGITVWASFGPAAGLYTLLYNTIPVFSFLRAPARMGILVPLALSVLAAGVLAAHFRRLTRPALAAAIVTLVVAAELMPAPLRQLRAAEPVSSPERLLATLPPGPVVVLPYYHDRINFHRHGYYMLQSTAHFFPLVNGYSDHIPQDFRDNARALSAFPTRESFAILEAIGARYALIHAHHFDEVSRERIAERLEAFGAHLRLILQKDGVWLYEITSFPAAEG
ncbi:MAG: hypothetical protein Q8L86_12625 [Vicinamibacterales bacterium]|nr:hypothetical protein [Vicinamibacterales bacterium]